MALVNGVLLKTAQIKKHTQSVYSIQVKLVSNQCSPKPWFIQTTSPDGLKLILLIVPSTVVKRLGMKPLPDHISCNY